MAAWVQRNVMGLIINNISCIVTTDFGFITFKFLNPKVNVAFKKILDAWTRYLATPDLTNTLTAICLSTKLGVSILGITSSRDGS